MTKQELLKKEQITKQEVYEYFNVKDYSELLRFLEMKTSTPFEDLEIDDSYIYNSFNLIASESEKDNFHPVKEKFMLFSVIMSGVYNFDAEEYSLIAKGLGTFKTVFLMEQILGGNEITVYYTSLYNDYYNKKYSLPMVVSKGIASVLQLVEEQFSNLDEGSLEKYAAQLQEALSKIVPDDDEEQKIKN